MKIRALLVSIISLLAADIAIAEEISPEDALNSDCYDDNMTDRCDLTVQREVRARFGLRSIEELNAANIQARRSFSVDGHGNDLPVISFERAPREAPQVRVSMIVAGNNTTRVVSIAAPVSLETWNDVIEQSRYFHRRLAEEPALTEEPLPPGYVRVPGICLHSWVMTVEASDPGEDAPMRRATQDLCNDGLVAPFAQHAAALAFQALPACSGIKLEGGRTPIVGLSLCALLDGDTMAAGEALNQAMMLRVASAASPMLIHDQAEINWQGEQIRGYEASRAWERLVGRNLLNYYQVSGRDSDHASITGEFVEYERNTEGYPRHRTARFEQVWVRENGFDFRMRTMRVEHWGDWSR